MNSSEELNKLFEDIELTAQTAGFNGFLILQRLGSRWSASYQLDRAQAMVRVRQTPLEVLCALRDTMLELVTPKEEEQEVQSGVAL
jgi:hypothetical protein